MIEFLSIIILFLAGCIIGDFIYLSLNPWRSIERMGNMKTWWIFGFEPLGTCKPYKMIKNDIVMKPLFM